jgi:predicted transcriptional regulator
MNIAVIIIIGEKIITHKIQAQRSKILLKIFAQLSREVVFISITGILFIRERVVFVFVTSNEFVIYLYLIQKILVNSHNSSNSFLLKSLSIFNNSSHFFCSKSFLISLIHQINFNFFVLISSLFAYQMIS